MTGAGASLPQLGITGAHTGDTLRIVDVFRKSDDDEYPGLIYRLHFSACHR